MNEYNRWISYLYEYVNGKKEDNVGFLRMEVRGPQCRIRIGLAAARGDRNREGKVILLASGKSEVREVLLGYLPPLGTGREGGFMTRSENVAGSGMDWRAFSGLKIVYADPEREYRTYWDDRIQRMESQNKRMREHLEEPVYVPEKPSIEEEEKSVVMPEEPSIEEEEETVVIAEEPFIEEEDEPVYVPEIPIIESEEENIIVSKDTPAIPQDPDKKSDTFSAAPAPSRSDEPRITWKQLRNIYPKILPFGPADTWEVMRICLQDIGRLPREHWILGANEFVIHGYYDHGHLALMRDEAGEFYFLGVPGADLEADRRVAELFGFRQYRPANQGGYWLKRIKL